jgi:hypothetical protein
MASSSSDSLGIIDGGDTGRTSRWTHVGSARKNQVSDCGQDAGGCALLTGDIDRKSASSGMLSDLSVLCRRYIHALKIARSLFSPKR